jgi:hypothetical protein
MGRQVVYSRSLSLSLALSLSLSLTHTHTHTYIYTHIVVGVCCCCCCCCCCYLLLLLLLFLHKGSLPAFNCRQVKSLCVTVFTYASSHPNCRQPPPSSLMRPLIPFCSPLLLHAHHLCHFASNITQADGACKCSQGWVGASCNILCPGGEEAACSLRGEFFLLL